MTENAHSGAITSLCINPNGLTYTSTSSDGSIRFWDIRMQQMQLSPPAQATVVETAGTKMYGEIRAEGAEGAKIHQSLPILMEYGSEAGAKLH